VGIVTLLAASAHAQHETHGASAAQPVGPEVARCAQAQPVVDGIITAAMARLEAARQTNAPADMRAAIDDLQAALRDVRAQLLPCTALKPADPHAGHATSTVAAPPAAPAAASAPAAGGGSRVPDEG
jgi:hypothetical protein